MFLLKLLLTLSVVLNWTAASAVNIQTNVSNNSINTPATNFYFKIKMTGDDKEADNKGDVLLSQLSHQMLIEYLKSLSTNQTAIIKFISSSNASNNKFNQRLINNTQTDKLDAQKKQDLHAEMASANPAPKVNDPGARNYVIIVLLFYGAIVVVVLFIRIKPKKKPKKEDTDRQRAEYLLRGMRDDLVTKKILEQLSDKSYRDRAWNIYRANSTKRRDSDFERIRLINEQHILKNIEKKIEVINRKKCHLEEFEQLNKQIGVHGRQFIPMEEVEKFDADGSQTQDREQFIRKLSEWKSNFRMKLSPTLTAKYRSKSLQVKSKTKHQPVPFIAKTDLSLGQIDAIDKQCYYTINSFEKVIQNNQKPPSQSFHKSLDAIFDKSVSYNLNHISNSKTRYFGKFGMDENEPSSTSPTTKTKGRFLVRPTSPSSQPKTSTQCKKSVSFENNLSDLSV